MQRKLPITKDIQHEENRSIGSDFFNTRGGVLTLKDGQTFAGQMPAWQSEAYVGEVVFNTGMTGYVESLSDPSYAGQILVFTYPLIGNYGVRLDAAESARIQVSGVVMSESAEHYSKAATDLSLPQWLASQNIPLLSGVDTRALTKHLRLQGTMAGAIAPVRVRTEPLKLSKQFVTIETPLSYQTNRRKKVILVDCGAKENILRSLLALNVQVKRVPYDYDYTQEAYDGVLLSNGPGNPADYQATIAIARRALKHGKPVFGICLGSQLMGLAAGARTYRLKFGHRGHNQPCLASGSDKAYITSQNHGYAIEETSLPGGWCVSFRNLNDGSVEGIEHRSKPFFSVQFHPEACPGPTDTAWLFERFYRSL